MRILKRLFKHKPASVALIVVGLLVALAVIAPLLTPYDPEQQNLAAALRPPSADHWLGTDNLGRDIATRLLFGGRYSLLIAVLAIAFGIVIGVPLGVISGFFGGWVDATLQRVTDVLLSFSLLVLAIALVAVLGLGVSNVILAVGISRVPIFIRLVRGSVLSLREEAFVEASVGLGASNWRIIRKHLLRNAMTPVIVTATLSMGITIISAAGLGFLGLGVPPPTPEWGAMLGEGREFLFSNPNLVTIPGIVIMVSVLSFNLLGDGLRDALDPRQFA